MDSSFLLLKIYVKVQWCLPKRGTKYVHGG